MISFKLCINNAYRISFISKDIENSKTDIELMVKNYLPGGEIDLSKTKVDYEVKHVFSTKRYLYFENKKLTIYDDWRKDISLDLWHLLYSVVRLYYLGDNRYPVHAACLGINNYVLLVGHTGVGKTTLTLKMANDFGAKILSGNKTVVSIDSDGIRTVAGTQAISLRGEDLKCYPNLVDKVVKFSNRAVLFLDKKYYSQLDVIKIIAIFVVKINDNGDEIIKLEHPTGMHLLYPYFMDTVYADTVMCGGSDVFSGETTRESRVQLAKSLAENLGKLSIFRISGSVKYIATEIEKWL